MFLKRAFVAMLLGTTMLAGCKGDSESNATGVPQGTFDELTAKVGDLQKNNDELLRLIAELQARPDADTAETRILIADLEKRLAQKDAVPADWQEVLAKLEGRMAAAEADLQGFKNLNLELLGTDVAELKSKMQKVEDDITALQGLQARLIALGETMAKLETTSLSKEDLAKVQGLDSLFKTLSDDFTKSLAAKADLTSFDKLNAEVVKLEKDKVSATEFGAAHKTVDAKLALLETTAKTGELSVDALKERLDKLETDLKPFLPEVREDIAGLTNFVNPFIGTQRAEVAAGPVHSGNVNPGAQTPFGMVSFGPDTKGSGQPWGYGSGGYDYQDKSIDLFSMTHLNGPGCRGQGGVGMLPVINSFASTPYSHNNEKAEPGYYRVTFDNKITTELTATTRTGMARFSFPDAAQAYLIIDTTRANGMTAPLGGADGTSVALPQILNLCPADQSWPLSVMAPGVSRCISTPPLTNL